MAGHNIVLNIPTAKEYNVDHFFNIAKSIVLVKDLTDVIDFDLINSEFDKLTFKKNISNGISEEMHLFDKAEFAEIKSKLELECESYMRNAHQVIDFEHLRITNSWGNITSPGESHHDHSHPFSVVSGTLYLDDNPDNLNLCLDTYSPDIPYFLYKKTSFISLKRLIGEENNLKNHMVLFLSNTGHHVGTTESTVPRRSIAFNTFWKGLIGKAGADLGSIEIN